MKAPLRIIIVVAHPDEAEEYAAGTIALLTAAGHYVKILSMTNGDVGHLTMGPKPLARRRAGEAYRAARILNVADYEILDHHDAELNADNETRNEVIRRIRRWQADIVLTFHDDCSGHSDNRHAAQAVREAVGLLGLPNVCRDTPVLERPPMCLRMVDYGSIGHHRHDIVVDVDSVIEQKLRACAAHATQFFEFAPAERELEVPAPDDWERAREFILQHWSDYLYASDDMRPSLAKVYGEDRATGVTYAESFEVARYGRHLTVEAARDELCAALGVSEGRS